MTFHQLTYVVEISKCGSINKAAHKLHLSQSGISSAVRELEEELGIQFFRRSNRGVEFTPEGKEFLSYAVSLLEQKQRIEGLYGQNRNAAAPERFSVSTQRYPFTEDAFLRMLQATQESRFRFSLKETGMDAVIDDVYDHRSDIGVIFLTELTEKMIRRLLDARRAVPLGPAAMETLTVIAYNQPVSRAFIEQVRGVDSSSSVTSLLEKGLIEEAGRLDLPGRPVSFRTTDVFLRCFGLSSLADLPPVHSAEDETTKAEEANE